MKYFLVISAAIGVLIRVRNQLAGFKPVVSKLPHLPAKIELPILKDVSQVRVEKNYSFPGPESLVITENYLYTGLADGRIVRVAKNWTSTTIARTCGNNCPDLKTCHVSPWDAMDSERRCGRPLGMRILPSGDSLLVADAYKGLLKVSLITGQVEELTGYIGLTNDVALSPDGTKAYFTVTSKRFERRRIFYAAMEMRPTGRLYRYDLTKNTTRIIARRLHMPNGLEIINNGKTALVVCGLRVLAFNLIMSKANATSFIPVLPGTGDNFRLSTITPANKSCAPFCFWFGLGSTYSQPFNLLNFVQEKPNLRTFLVGILPYRAFVELIPKAGILAVFDSEGNILEFYHDPGGTNIGPWFSEAHSFGDFIYFGSWYNPYLARVPIADFAALSSSS
mmetsp:Transcript_1295/g.1668  ORF Transcript_1295/g.1668 Transcript_1295/m.1668 type:complete len:393 (-) Transcript_1295:1417-2595(-)